MCGPTIIPGAGRPKGVKPGEGGNHYLTPYRLELLAYVAGGANQAEIARALKRHHVTIRQNMGYIRKALKARTAAQAAVMAVRMGLVEPRELPVSGALAPC